MKTPAREEAGITQTSSASITARMAFTRIAWKIRMEKPPLFCFLISVFLADRGPPFGGASSLCQMEPLPREEVAP
jgi:hypothetical protein